MSNRLGFTLAEKKKPTQEEIAKEIETLKEMQPKVRKRGMSGDNRDAIGAQIEVLEKNMTHDQIWEKFGPDETAEEDAEDQDAQYVVENAIDARSWLDGDTHVDLPSEGWQSLVE